MAWTTTMKTFVNRRLEPLNVQITSCAAERAERARLESLDRAGQFGSPILPVLKQFNACDPMPLIVAVSRFRDRMQCFSSASSETGYSYHNDYFTSPDGEVAYAMVRRLAPKCLVEVGSGHSTKLFRSAIQDGALTTKLISIDPSPRTPIFGIADEVISQRVEDLPPSFFLENLGRDDILFIDSSHHIQSGNDVLALTLKVIPILKPGVAIHYHDIFLPFEYPREWMIERRWTWNEQYLVHALLDGTDQLEVLWPGHFLQRALPGFKDHFAPQAQGRASSLWLRKLGGR
jgi:Methyltransferase domain